MRQKNRRRKSKVSCMYGPVAQQSPIPTFSDQRATVLQLGLIEIGLVIHFSKAYRRGLIFITLVLTSPPCTLSPTVAPR